MAVVNSAYIGGLTGVVKRTRRGTPTVIVSVLIAGVAIRRRERSVWWPCSPGFGT